MTVDNEIQNEAVENGAGAEEAAELQTDETVEAEGGAQPPGEGAAEAVENGAGAEEAAELQTDETVEAEGGAQPPGEDAAETVENGAEPETVPGTVPKAEPETGGEPAEAVAAEGAGEASEQGEAPEEEDEVPLSIQMAKPKEGMDWYVLHTYSGYEKKVKEQLRNRLEQSGMGDFVGRIEIPEERVVEIKSGKKRESNRMFFPGYVLIEMAMSEKLWYVVKETPRITGFLGDSHVPTPLKLDEVGRIMEQITGVADKPRPKHSYNIGEPVRVIDGPFANFSGVLDEVNMERGKVKVMVSIFGRATPVELEFSQIEKI